MREPKNRKNFVIETKQCIKTYHASDVMLCRHNIVADNINVNNPILWLCRHNIVADNINVTKHYVGRMVRFDTLFCRDIASFLLF